MTRVVIHINRLVLKGLRQGDRQAIAVGLQKELSRVFRDREAVQHVIAVGDTSRLPVAGVRIEHGFKPQRIGVNVARGIHKEIKK